MVSAIGLHPFRGKNKGGHFAVPMNRQRPGFIQFFYQSR